MQTIRHDQQQPELHQPGHYQANWIPAIVLTWSQAHRLIANVCVAMIQAGYRGDDITRMRTTMEEALLLLLEREQQPGRARPVQVSYRVNQLQALVEIQTRGAGHGPQSVVDSGEIAGLPADLDQQAGPPHPFMTSIRYSRQSHTATVCDCQLIQ
jgi:hypothetical protein